MEWHVCMHVNKYSHTHCHAHSYDMYINITYLQICMHACIYTPDLSVCLVVHQPHVCLNTSHKNIVTSTWFTNFKILIIFWHDSGWHLAHYVDEQSFLLLMNTHAAVKQWMDSKGFALGNVLLSDLIMKLTIQSRQTSHQLCNIF
jgi:hypothetical protein